ncbi:MAG: CDP-diacylglycerol--glycerol-3-phosphate 3-phosphatidyltransferase [Clostridiaceae bacterium]|nr:CDP-diacylglycerol--glycerol-3-phosphate 3-phosphatidyltransferase [Clostridiaceae bacterium]
MKINLATKITLVRLLLIPVMMVLFILGFYINTSVYALPAGGEITANLGFLIAAMVVFVIAALTDFADGKIARSTNTVTNLGKFLDPIADKVLVFTALALIMAYNFIPEPYMSVSYAIILTREFMVSALRMSAGSKGIIIAADGWGKVKTLFTDFAIGFLICAPIHAAVWYIGVVLYAIAVLLTIYSGLSYIYKNRAVFKEEAPVVPAAEPVAVAVEVAVDNDVATDADNAEKE